MACRQPVRHIFITFFTGTSKGIRQLCGVSVENGAAYGGIWLRSGLVAREMQRIMVRKRYLGDKDADSCQDDRKHQTISFHWQHVTLVREWIRLQSTTTTTRSSGLTGSRSIMHTKDTQKNHVTLTSDLPIWQASRGCQGTCVGSCSIMRTKIQKTPCDLDLWVWPWPLSVTLK